MLEGSHVVAASPLLPRRIALALLAAAALARAGSASTVPTGFHEAMVISGRTEPTAVRFSHNDDKVFVAEKSGLLWVYAGVSDPGPKLVIDLRASVYDFWDRGMLGLAVDPQYPVRPYVYVLYTHDTWPPGDPRFGDPTQPRWGTGLPNPSTSDPCPTPPGATTGGCVVYGRLSRITIDQQTMLGTEQVLLEGNWCQQFPSHSIGDLLFGDDGYLYASAGEGASFSDTDIGLFGTPPNPCGDPTNGGGTASEGGSLRSQDILTSGDPTSFDGSVLRLDVSSIPVRAPSDNPLVGVGAPDDDFIVATGLRNPFRMTHRPGTAEIWIGDVGENHWEEINRITSPSALPVEDFGWPCYEGGNGVNEQRIFHAQQTLCQRIYGNAGPPLPSYVSMVPSYYAYNHDNPIVSGGDLCPTGSSAIAGMFFNTGTAFPAHYQNALIFEDATRQCIYAMIAGTNGLPDPTKIENLVSNATGEIVDLQKGPDGALYYVEFDHGQVYRVSYSTGNQPPTARVSATPSNGTAPLTVSFSAAASTDPEDGSNLSYSWDLDGDQVFGDAITATPSFTYTHPGVYNVSVRVTDSQGASSVASIAVTAGNTPPVVSITAPASGFHWTTGQTINFTGQAIDPQDGPLPPSQLSWLVILHHCHAVGDCHTHFITTLIGDSGSVEGPEHEYPSYLELQLTATDLPPPDWFDAAWSRRRKLTFDNTAQADDLQAFPVLVSLDPTRIDYAQTLPGGRDLRFADRSGNPLPYEIEQWNPGGVSTVWVQVPLIHAHSGTDSIWMYYGNPSATQSGENAAAVWSNGYAAVWHLSTLLDSTGNHNDGADAGTTATQGLLGPARLFNGAARIDVAASPSLMITGAVTMEAWLRIADPNQSGAPRILDDKLTSTSPFGFDLEYQPLANNVTSTGSGADFARADGVDLDASWHYLAAELTGAGAGAIFVDGVNRTTDATASPLVASTQPLRIGSRAGTADFFSGALDEVRVSAVQRPASWIAAQYLSMADAFASYGPEQPQGTLSTTTSLNLDPLAVQISFDSVPSGMQLTAGTFSGAAPFSSTFIVGSHLTLNAPAQYGVGGKFAFTSWSDGGAQTHTIAAPSAPLSLVAQFHLAFECADGIDNDGDGKVDYPADPGCKDATAFSVENPACNDGVDNDGDGKIDWPADPDCPGPWGTSESRSACGAGAELTPVLLALWLRRRVGAAATRAARSR